MRLLYVVQRYGEEVAGGAELHCRQFATRMAARGHDVEVLTSCARSYVDWADFYAPGTSELDGVRVHRLAVRRPRSDRVFGPLNARVPWGARPVPLYLQEAWMKEQGPDLQGLDTWLVNRSTSFDVVVFFTYLYNTTWQGLRAVAGRTPTVLHPTAHDEPPLYLPIFDLLFRIPDAFAFSVEEEKALVERRFGINAMSATIGIGMEEAPSRADAEAFRRQFGIGDRPYLLFVGRLDPGKGSLELYDFFAAYKKRNPGDLALVLLGEPVRPVEHHPDVVVTGFVSDEVLHAAMEGSTALVQPSFFESFSMVLTEAWLHGRPALVQGRCDVLVGQARRSGGGLPYSGYAEFEACVDWLLGNDERARRMGEAGKSYVESRYQWDTVLTNYEALLECTAGPMRRRRSVVGRRPAVAGGRLGLQPSLGSLHPR